MHSYCVLKDISLEKNGPPEAARHFVLPVVLCRSHIAPDRGDLQNEEDDRKNCKYRKADDRPHLELRLNGATFVFTVKGLAGAAERVDALGVAGLKHDEDDRGKRGDRHKGDQRIVDGVIDIGEPCRIENGRDK